MLSCGPLRRFSFSLGASQTPPIVGRGRVSRKVTFLQRRRRHPPSSANVNASRLGLPRGEPFERAARLLHDELTPRYVPLLMRPWIMHLTPLATSVSLARFYGRALLLVDKHGHLHAVVASSLSTVPGANVFQTDVTLPHPLSPPAIRSWCRGGRRLLWPSPYYTSGKLLHYTLHGSIQPSRTHVRRLYCGIHG